MSTQAPRITEPPPGRIGTGSAASAVKILLFSVLDSFFGVQKLGAKARPKRRTLGLLTWGVTLTFDPT